MNRKIMFFSVAFLALGLIFGAFFGFYYARKDYERSLASARSIREGRSGHEFINPLLACELPEAKDVGEYAGLEKNINTLIAQKVKNHEVNDISLFLIRNGLWIGINENVQYEPASMLKVVLMIAYLKEREVHPDLFEKTLVYSPQIKGIADQIPYQATSSSYIVGRRYRIDDLINKMITESDNAAMYMLLDGIDQNTLKAVYNDLGISSPDNATGVYTISAKSYSLFFRILYNATYLTRPDSEYALGLLAKTHFNDGLVAGLPKGSVVSHKYGEKVVSNPDGTPSGVELHDCGFIYPPDQKRPYFLCVMTKGQNMEGLKKTISDISASVYMQLPK